MADAQIGAAYLDSLAESRPVSVTPLALQSEIEKLWDDGLLPGASTGWPSVDKHYTVASGQLTIVTGWPSSGKSEWLDAMLIHLSRQGWCTSIFSPENQPTSVHGTKMLEKITGKPFGRGPTERMGRDEIPHFLAALNKSFRFITAPDSGSLSVKAVIDAASPWLLQQRKRGLVIDPWNELEHWRPDKLSETEYVSQQLSYVRNWARKHEVHVWIVAHPQKMRAPDGKLPVPRPDMISGSQHWWNKADCALTVYRDMELVNDNEIELHIQKVRFKHIGHQGVVKLRWDKPTGRYFEPPQIRSVANYYEP